jgi:hypothetical protein
VRSDVAAEVLAPFRTSGAQTVADAIAIYKNGFWTRQYQALAELFPRIVDLLGDASFRELVRRYLRACPSTHPELERLGSALPDFLRTQADPDLARLASIADYEQAHVESLLAADCRLAMVTEIRPHAFANARFELITSLRIVRIEPPLLEVLATQHDCVVGAHAAVIARPHFATTTHLIDREELTMLQLARSGAPVASLLDACGMDVPYLRALLEGWFRRCWIAAIDHKEGP